MPRPPRSSLVSIAVPNTLGGDRMALQAQRIMANITVPAASTTVTSDGYFPTDTFRM